MIFLIIVFKLIRKYCLADIKHKEEMKLQNDWMFNILNNKRMENFFRANSLFNIGVYGYNFFADELFYELYGTDIKVRCFIDDEKAGMVSFYPDCEIISLKDIGRIDDIDAVVITASNENSDIRSRIDAEYKGKIILISDLVGYMGGK